MDTTSADIFNQKYNDDLPILETIMEAFETLLTDKVASNETTVDFDMNNMFCEMGDTEINRVVSRVIERIRKSGVSCAIKGAPISGAEFYQRYTPFFNSTSGNTLVLMCRWNGRNDSEYMKTWV